MTIPCSPILGTPYPVDISVVSEEPVRGEYMDYDIYVETMENLDVIVSVAYYIPNYGWSDWKEIWRGYLPKTKKAFYRTLYIPEDAGTGSVVIWVQVQYSSDDFYGVKKEDYYYLHQELVHIAGHISVPSVKADYWRDQARYWKQKYGNLSAMYDDLMEKYSVLQGEYEKISTKYDDISRKYNECIEKYHALDLKYHILFNNYTKLKIEYSDLLRENAELKARLEQLEQAHNYVYMALIGSTITLLALGIYIYKLKKRERGNGEKGQA